MKIIEIFANRRSGHHFFMSWIISNISGKKDNKIKNLERITWINDEICHYNDATYHAFFNEKKVFSEIEDIINKKPKYFFINYEDSGGVYNRLNKEGTLIYENNPLKIIFVRDFLNTFASKWKVSETDLKNLYYGFNSNRKIIQNVESWKTIANDYLNEKYVGFKYENLLYDNNEKTDFLKNNFNVDETFKSNELKGTKSSFNTLNFNDRYKEVNFSDNFKKIIYSDSELNYLIGALGYDYRKI